MHTPSSQLHVPVHAPLEAHAKQSQKPEQGVGPLIAIIVIVLLLAAGGVYFLISAEMERRAAPPVGSEQASL